MQEEINFWIGTRTLVLQPLAYCKSNKNQKELLKHREKTQLYRRKIKNN